MNIINEYLKNVRKILIILFVNMMAITSLFSQNEMAFAAGKTYEEPKDEKVKEKLAAWQDLKFGLFMHWGTYSIWGVVESWSLCPEDVSFTQRKGPYAGDYYGYKKAYENLQTQFNPTLFNPDKWALAAKNAGMKYVVFTTKHHDGFCMFDTKYTDYKITSSKTPFSSNPKSNITKEVLDAFRKDDFMLGVYFSKPDWHSEDFWWSYFPVKDRGVNYDIKKYPERWKRFNDYTFNQVEELMTEYGKLDILWFDGQPRMEMSSIVEMARKDQPGIIIVNRYGKPEYINYLTPEQTIPEKYIPYPWETCMTMGRAWSYNPVEKFKPARKLIQILVDIVAKNGNLLLNIGPGPDGEWHKEAYDRLEEIGKWIKVNGESIYGTKPVSPYRQDKWAFTGKDQVLYISYLPDENESLLAEKMLIPFPSIDRHSRISLLGSNKSLKWIKVNNKIQVEVPKEIVRQFSGQPVWVFKIR